MILVLGLVVLSPTLAGAAPRSRVSAVASGDGSWRGRGPAEPVRGPCSIYDPVRQRMVAFGGQTGSQVANSSDLAWELSLNGTPSWTALTVVASGPFGRQSASAIYDPVRDRMIVFGGRGGYHFNDVWALSLTGTPTWTQIVPAGGAPVGREGQTAIYDPVRDRMIVFGGNDASHVDHNDVWALSLSGTPTWTQLTTAGTPPQPRGRHSAIYDPVRDRMVIFAGFLWTTSGWLNDTWSLSLSGTPTWSPLVASGTPGARNSHSAIYDPVGDRMIVYGGYNDPTHPADLTVLSFGGSPAWSILTPSGTPPSPRDGQTMVYDAPRQRVVIYAGIDDDFGHAWAATLSGTPTWSPIAPVGIAPSGWARTVYDPVRDRMIALVGQGAVAWARNLSGEPAWTPLTIVGGPPPARDKFSAIYDPLRDRIVTYGGAWSEEIWTLGLGTLTWSKLDPSGPIPAARYAHTATYDPLRDRMIVYGGGDGGSLSTEIWAYSFGSGSWSQITPTGVEPPGRAGHTAIYDAANDRMVVCGGIDGAPFSHDVWGLDLASFTWTEIVPAVALPTGRAWMSAVYDSARHRMLLFGGYDGVTGLDTNDLWSLDLGGSPTWTLLAPSGTAPRARQEHDAIYDRVRDRMVAFGGNDIYSFHDVWEYSPAATGSVPEVTLDRGAALALAAPRPNPSSNASVLAFTLGRAGRANLDIFDVGGRRIRRLLDAALSAGPHSAEWRGDDDRGKPVMPGLYFARLRCGREQATQRLLRVE